MPSTICVPCGGLLPVPMLEVATALTAGLGTNPVETESTYDFVATSVESVVVPSMVIICVAKLPELSRLTMVLATSLAVAALAAVAPAAILAAETPLTDTTTVALCVPVTSPDRLPLKFVAVTALVALVAVLALPFNAAVIIFAAKLPAASRLTIVLTTLLAVAALAAVAPAAILAAETPLTELTTVADCVPTTSPDNEPVKLVAVVAVVALPVRLPLKLPVRVPPTVKLPSVVKLPVADR